MLGVGVLCAPSVTVVAIGAAKVIFLKPCVYASLGNVGVLYSPSDLLYVARGGPRMVATSARSNG